MFETGFERNAKRCARISGRDWKARWARQSARADQIARATNGRDPRDETRGDQSGQAVASTRPQTAEALLKISVLSIISRLRWINETAVRLGVCLKRGCACGCAHVLVRRNCSHDRKS